MKKFETEIVIIGAGLTGLTISYYLNKFNKRFITIDRNDRVGGVIQTCYENGFVYEKGPNTGVISNTSIVELFDELSQDCKIQMAGSYKRKRYILKAGKWHHLPMGLIDAIKTPLFSTYDKFRITGEPFRKRGDNPHENLADFVKRRLGDSFLKYAVDPFILGVYAGDPEKIIPKYALPKLYNLEQKYGSLILGGVRKIFEKKSSIEKRVNRKVFSVKNGLSSLTDTLYKKAGIENFQLNAKNVVVDKLLDGYQVSFTNKNNEPVFISAKNIITTVGSYELAELLPFVNKGKMLNICTLSYAKVVVVIVGFRKWNGIKLDGFGGLIPFVEKRDILGILYISSLFENRAPKAGALLSIFIGGVRREELTKLNDSKIKQIVEKECKELLALNEFNPDLFKIFRYNNAIPQYGIESGNRISAIAEIQQENKGLFIGGNLIDGIGMADRIQQGCRLAEKVILLT